MRLSAIQFCGAREQLARGGGHWIFSSNFLFSRSCMATWYCPLSVPRVGMTAWIPFGTHLGYQSINSGGYRRVPMWVRRANDGFSLRSAFAPSHVRKHVAPRHCPAEPLGSFDLFCTAGEAGDRRQVRSVPAVILAEPAQKFKEALDLGGPELACPADQMLPKGWLLRPGV
eukprot:scaffold30_cov255-Pinguiococcus_pyrenoidosus.AAC.2